MAIEVQHPRHGTGRIVDTMHGGYRLRVAFDDGMTRWVALDEVTTHYVAEEQEAAPASAGDATKLAAAIGPLVSPAKSRVTPRHTPMAADSFEARTMVEAFRMGIVPYDCVGDFTFGRDQELADISHWLERQRRGTFLLLGDYGTGKTHLIESILRRGLDAGYAVARAEIDPSERPFHKPKRVYARLVETLRWRDGNGEIQRFEAFVRAAARKGAWGEHAYLRYASSQHDGVALWNWLEAREAIPRPYASEEWFQAQVFPPLYDYSNAGNIYSYLLTALGWAAKSALDLRGLLLIFDEAEAIDWTYTRYQSGKGLNFLRALVRAAANDERLLRVRTSQDLGPTRQGMARDVPFIFKVPTTLKVAFAFTSLDWNEFETWNGQTGRYVPELTNAAKVQLESLSIDVLEEVAREIRRVYAMAYPSSSVPDLDPSLILTGRDSSVTRLFVKAAVEALDLLRHHPDRPPAEVLRS